MEGKKGEAIRIDKERIKDARGGAPKGGREIGGTKREHGRKETTTRERE